MIEILDELYLGLDVKECNKAFSQRRLRNEMERRLEFWNSEGGRNRLGGEGTGHEKTKMK